MSAYLFLPAKRYCFGRVFRGGEHGRKLVWYISKRGVKQMIWSTRVLKPLPTTRARALLSSRPWRETVRLGCLWPGGKTENEISTTQWDTYCQRELPGSRSGRAQGQRWDEWLTPTVMAAHTLHKCAQRDHSARLHRQAPNRAQTAYKLWGYTPPIRKRAAWNEGRCELTGTH